MAKTREEWEKQFIRSLVNFREYLFQQETASLVGPKRASALNCVINAYFGTRRKDIPIPEASYYMNCEDMGIFINDVVLSYMSDEHPNFLDTDWQQKFVIKSEVEDSFLDDDELI